MDYFSLIRRSVILMLLTIAHAYAGTTVIYPQFSAYQAGASSATFGTTFKIPATETMSNNWGTKSGWFWQSPNAGSLAATTRMSAADAQSMYSAISGTGRASQSAAKIVAVGVLRAIPGIALLGIASDLGYQYVSNQWQKTVTAPTNTVGYIPFGSLGPYDCNAAGGCSNHADFFVRSAQEWNILCAPAMSAVINVNQSWIGYCHHSVVPDFGGTSLVTDTDWLNAPSQITRSLTDAELAEMVRLGYAVPIDKPAATVIGDFSALTAAELATLTAMGYFQQSPITVNNGPAFTDPVTGDQLQPKLTVEAAPNGGVRVSSSDQPVDAAGDPAKNADGTDKAPTDSADPCAGNPDSVQCSTLGSLDPAGDPLPTTHNLSFQPGTLATAGTCPAPRSMSALGHPIAFSYQPICDAASTYIRPFVLLASAIASYFIFVGGLRT